MQKNLVLVTCFTPCGGRRMKKNNWKNRVKRIVALMMLVCMLFGTAHVGTDAGIMPCGELWDEIEQL